MFMKNSCPFTLIASLWILGSTAAATPDGAVPFAYASINTDGEIKRFVDIDIDLDGDTDFVTYDEEFGEIRIFLNDGAGEFCLDTSIELMDGAGYMRVADVTGNGFPDIVLVSATLEEIRILVNGDSGFDGSEVVSGGPSSFTDVAIGDIDGDGDLDLVVVAGSVEGEVHLYLNNGAGEFVPGGSFPCGRFPTAIDLADLDQDGNLDIGIANNTSPGSFNDDHASVLIQNENGGFDSFIQYLVGDKPTDIELVDLNGDGIPDLSVLTDDGLFIRDGLGDGHFSDARYRRPLTGAISFRSHDIDHDGDLDYIVSSDLYNGHVYVLHNNGDGRFLASDDIIWPLERVYRGPIGISDYDLDGHADIALLGDGYIYMFRQEYRGIGVGNDFARPMQVNVGNDGNDFDVLYTGDLDGDGLTELLLWNSSLNTVRLLSYQTDGAFVEAQPPFDLPNGSYRPAVGDLNNDGVLDLVVNHGDHDVDVYLGDGSGGYGTPVRHEFFGNGQNIILKDIDHDGDLDALFAVYISSPPPSRTVVIELLNDGSGNLTRGNLHRFEGVSYSRLVACLDMNGDSELDLVLQKWTAEYSVFVCLGVGNGAFAPAEIVGSTNEQILLFGDIDQNTVPELYYINRSSPNTQAYTLGMIRFVGGAFETNELDIELTSTRGFGMADLDDDGRPEFLISRNVGRTYTQVYTISSSFELESWFTLPGSNRYYEAIDLENDGDVDLIGHPGLRVLKAGDTSVPVCSADLNNDDVLDINDAIHLLVYKIDYNNDGAFNFYDITSFIEDYLAGCP